MMESAPLMNICESQPATVEKEPETVGFGQDGNLKPAVPHFKLASFSDMYKIGEGGEGTVYRANSGQFGEVALKCLRQKTFVKGNSREIEVLVKIRHPHIVQIFGIIQNGYDVTRPSGFVMEYMKMGSLHKGEYFNSNMESSASTLIHSSAINYEMGQIYSWIIQASLGLQYLHEHSLLHRDIKPQNMLLGFSIDHLKLADFGLARETTVTSITGGIGTVHYMAPEVIQTTSYAAPADVYSLTISIWEMIHRRRPFDEEQETSNFKIAADVRNGRRPLVAPLLVDTEMETLLQKGWHENPDKRISVTEITVFSRAKLGPNSSVDHAASIVETSSGSSLQPRSQKSALLISNYPENNTIAREKRRAKDSLRAAGILLILMAFGIGVWIYGEKVVKLANTMGKDVVVTANCASGDNKIGEYKLKDGEDFVWKFKPNFFGNTRFYCGVTTNIGKSHHWDVFKGHWGSESQYWYLRGDGGYSGNDDGTCIKKQWDF